MQTNGAEQKIQVAHTAVALCFFYSGDKNKTICWRKDILFTIWCWENQISICRKFKLDPYLSHYKNQFKMDKDLNERPKL
jgi:hypothetical protein